MHPKKPGKNEVLLQDPVRDRWILFKNPLKILKTHESNEVLSLLNSVENAVESEGLTAAGFVGYEAAPAFDSSFVTRKPDDKFPLAWFGLYEQGEDYILPPGNPVPPADGWTPSISEAAYRNGVRQVRECIKAGDTYQVNYSFRLRTDGAVHAWETFLGMTSGNGPGYGVYLETDRWAVCSFSPELFFQLDGQDLFSRPMKGTRQRGRWLEEDQELKESLSTSPKDRAENLMILDMVRNDLGRIAETGSVKVDQIFEIEQYPTLFQMTSTVRCRTKAGLEEIFSALFPPASITGAPKISTMRIISELEDSPRRIYTGTMGYVAPGRNAQFNVAIRTALFNKSNGQAEYGIGGGIVWDSTEESELAECYSKAAVLTRENPEFDLLESLLWTPEAGCQLLENHLSRMESSAVYFGREIDKKDIRKKMEKLGQKLGYDTHKIRLLLDDKGNVGLEPEPLRDLPDPYRVCLARNPVDSSNVFLFHKTTCRETYARARRDCPGFDDVLLWNERGELTESTIANLVVELDGRLFTPPVNCGLLPGVQRARLLENNTVSTRIIRPDEISCCTRIFLANSVRGLWEVDLEIHPDRNG